MADNQTPSALDKLEAYVEISNLLTRICHLADESINGDRPATIEELSQYLTDDAVWNFYNNDGTLSASGS